MNVLLGTRSMNDYWHQIALALHEAHALGRYRTGYVDAPRTMMGRLLRSAAGWVPSLDRALSARRIPGIPPALVQSVGGWDLARSAAGRLRCPSAFEDWLFIQGEMSFDAGCADDLSRNHYDAVLVTEFGALTTLRTARRLGQRSLVGFVSPHHQFREKWVDSAIRADPALMTPARRRLMRLARERDERRDQEMYEADLVLSCSPLVTRTLHEAGVPAHRILTVLLGCPEAIAEKAVETTPRFNRPLQVMYAGLLAAHKGIPSLLQAWKDIRAGAQAELHLYGHSLLPPAVLNHHDASVKVHGSVGRADLYEAYQRADILVFPSLCDGFGAVVTEAFSRGLPAIVSENAGASALVKEGENGFVIAAADAGAISNKLAWCLANRQALAAMRRSAWQSARARGWSVFREELRRAWHPALEKAA